MRRGLDQKNRALQGQGPQAFINPAAAEERDILGLGADQGLTTSLTKSIGPGQGHGTGSTSPATLILGPILALVLDPTALTADAGTGHTHAAQCPTVAGTMATGKIRSLAGVWEFLASVFTLQNSSFTTSSRSMALWNVCKLSLMLSLGGPEDSALFTLKVMKTPKWRRSSVPVWR